MVAIEFYIGTTNTHNDDKKQGANRKKESVFNGF